MNDHHLILGEVEDFITGRTITDTHDERLRQKIARLLVEQKGYSKSDISPNFQLTVTVDGKCAKVPVTYVVAAGDRAAMIVHYGPGSLVTRHRPAIAMGRLVEIYQVPVVVVTNGVDADILDGGTGNVTAKGLTGIPQKQLLINDVLTRKWKRISSDQAQREARIIMAYEVNDRCPCDDSVCLTAEP
jgi:hypothetical protein